MNYDHSNSESARFDNSEAEMTPVSRDRAEQPAAAKSTTHRCSYCGVAFDRSQSKNMPFCSRRCQEIDLGMWLNESYGLPVEAESDIGDGLRYEDEDEE